MPHMAAALTELWPAPMEMYIIPLWPGATLEALILNRATPRSLTLPQQIKG